MKRLIISLMLMLTISAQGITAYYSYHIASNDVYAVDDVELFILFEVDSWGGSADLYTVWMATDLSTGSWRTLGKITAVDSVGTMTVSMSRALWDANYARFNSGSAFFRITGEGGRSAGIFYLGLTAPFYESVPGTPPTPIPCPNCGGATVLYSFAPPVSTRQCTVCQLIF